MNTQQALKEWGLNEKETKVYLANLELGQSKVNEIAKKFHFYIKKRLAGKHLVLIAVSGLMLKA